MYVGYLALYDDNTDIHLSAYLLPCVNEVLFTASVHIYIYRCTLVGYIHDANLLY